MMITLRKTLLFPIFLLYSVTSWTQDMKMLDSLKKQLSVAKEDTHKVNTLVELSNQTRNVNVQSSIEYAEEALVLARKLKFQRGQAVALYSLGRRQAFIGMNSDASKNLAAALSLFELLHEKSYQARSHEGISEIYLNESNYTESLKHLLIALELREQIGDKKWIAVSHLNIGRLLNAQGNNHEALERAYKALRIFEEVEDRENLAFTFVLIAQVYEGQGNYPEALSHYKKCLTVFEELKMNPSIASAHIAISGVLFRQGDYGQAMEKNLAALRIFEEWGAPEYVAWAYESIGDILAKEGASPSVEKRLSIQKLTEAENRYLQALKIYEETENKESLASIYNRLGNTYIELGKLQLARSYIEKGLQLSSSININYYLKDSYSSLAYLDSLQGNFKQALDHYKKFILYRDSLGNEENTKKMVQTRMEYEFDKKDALARAEQARKDAEARRVKNIQYFTIAGLAILVLAILGIAFIQWKNSKQKQKANLLLKKEKEKVERTLSELKSTQAQLIQSEKMASLGQLTAGIAHEIQNPLNFVNNFSEVNKELLLEMNEEIDKGNITDVKAIARNIISNEEKINHHGKRADAIVKGMLQHSRSSNGVKESTDINALADEYLRLAYHGLRAKDKSFNATMKTDFDQSIGRINIIPQDIGRVILNLINNAFYAVDEKRKQQSENYEPTVSVTTKKTGDKISVTVSDNGNGIPEKQVDKIFQPFFTTKPTGQGTGLGLSLSYDTIRAHRGEIKVQTTEGNGAEFCIELPNI